MNGNIRKHSAAVTASPPASRSGPNTGESPSPRKKLRITIKRPPQVWKNDYDPQPHCNNDTNDRGSNTSSNNNINRGQPSTSTTRRPTTIHDLFDVQKLLGEGGFGKVYLAVRRCDQQLVALKAATILNNNGLYPSAFNCNEESLQREVSALIALSDPGHPHVCRLYNSPLRDNSHSYLAMEYIGGGELFEHLVNRGPFSEHDAAKFFRQFADALHYIHSKGYVHCDLKPENLMMGSWEKEEPRLKVVDFGFSVPDQESIKLASYGTVAYLPPECLVNGHSSQGDPWHPNTAGDMFAAGVIMYTVLTGTHPFDRTNQASNFAIANSIVASLTSTTEYSTTTSDSATSAANSSNDICGSRSTNDYLATHVFDDRTDGLSSSSISLMRGLLHPDPKHRMTSCQLRHHPWILGQTASTHCLSSGHHSKLQAFWQRRFRAAILEKFWGESAGHRRGQDRRRQTLSHKESEIIFRSMDFNGDGTVSLEELKRSMMNDSSSPLSIDGNRDDSGGNTIKQYMLDDIFSSIDEDGSGGIDLGEFKRVMCQKVDGNDGTSNSSSKNDCNTGSDNVCHSCDGNHNDIDEQILAISNEQVRGCIFQKFGGIEREAVWGSSQGSNHSTRETLRIIFDTMDLNKDGFLQLSEAITVLRETPELDEDMISLWADKADIDLNGEIDFEEFCIAMTGNYLNVSHQ